MKKRTCDACGSKMVFVEFLHTLIYDGIGDNPVDWAEPGWECPRCGEMLTERQAKGLDEMVERMRREDLAAQRQME